MEMHLLPNNILGISAYYHDSAAALVRDGEIVAAAQEERFTRVKGDASFPSRSVEYCLVEAGIEAPDLVTAEGNDPASWRSAIGGTTMATFLEVTVTGVATSSELLI